MEPVPAYKPEDASLRVFSGASGQPDSNPVTGLKSAAVTDLAKRSHLPVQAEAAAREQAISGEQTARTEADRVLRQVLDDVQTGGVVLTVAGLVWLMFGIVLTSIPHWLACFAVSS